jgi:hypothetical protein
MVAFCVRRANDQRRWNSPLQQAGFVEAAAVASPVSVSRRRRRRAD